MGGGYNLRVLYRRAQSFIQKYKLKLDILDVVGWHIDGLSSMYPELAEHRDDVSKVLTVELSRYASSVERVSKVVSSIAASKKEVTLDEVVKSTSRTVSPRSSL